MKQKTIEITRSYAQKVNMGNYQTKDYFCSAKCECALEDSSDISSMLDELVQGEVFKSINAENIVEEDKSNKTTDGNIKPKEIQIP